ncbi:MAG: hypothetical protein H5T73_05985 [Actinobacteria bacterium]|nr:hypothetical protein [Actinomycetota bacterium]
MGFFGSFRRRPPEEVVFAGERMEAEFVVNLLRDEGFHPLLWADLPAPAYAGPLGMARVVVPAEEARAAVSFLSGLEEAGRREGEDLAWESGGEPREGPEGNAEHPAGEPGKKCLDEHMGETGED